MTEHFNKDDNPFTGFSKLTQQQRFDRLLKMGALTSEDIQYLQKGGIQSTELAENLIENVIGYFQIPLGVAANCRIDGRDYAIPMAVEETSIIAALSKTAKWIRGAGDITTATRGDLSIGQIQIPRVKNYPHFKSLIENHAADLIKSANREAAHSMVRRGGGVEALEIRRIAREDGSDMAVIHVLANTCDAMGANVLNQICEYLKNPIAELTAEEVGLCILSNLNDRKLASAHVVIHQIDTQLADKIEEASTFARMCPYRAATNNKGVLNGIDPVLIATGNDWRAVEAGLHAFAARDGQYRSITRWWREGKELHGELEAPITVGTVGGVTHLHPTARLCLRMLGVVHAEELSRVLAAVGLVQNLGALSALSTVGIIQGHMKLHITNLVLSTGASEKEQPVLRQRLETFLCQHQRITLSNAVEALQELRQEVSLQKCQTIAT